MKRMATVIVFSICVLAIGSWSYAQGKGGCYGRGAGKGVSASGSGQGVNFVDQDGDGICDNAGIRGAGKGRRNGRRFQAERTPGNVQQHGPRYVDENGDGVCDNFGVTQEKTK